MPQKQQTKWVCAQWYRRLILYRNIIVCQPLQRLYTWKTVSCSNFFICYSTRLKLSFVTKYCAHGERALQKFNISFKNIDTPKIIMFNQWSIGSATILDHRRQEIYKYVILHIRYPVLVLLPKKHSLRRKLLMGAKIFLRAFEQSFCFNI